MRTHVRILAWLQVLLGLTDLLLAILVFGVFAGIGMIAGLSGEPSIPLISGAIGTVLGALMALTALPNLAAGLGLLGHKRWARLLALVLAVFNVFKFPWGTALAVYTFWVLTDDETERLLGVE